MRWRYNDLTETPYLYSSKHLRGMYKDARNNDERECILQHLVNHQVHDDDEYAGYIKLSKQIQSVLAGHDEDEEIIPWSEMVSEYDIVQKNGKIQFKRRKQS